MNKRIKSMLMVFVMVISVLATAAPAYAAGSTSFKMTADKLTASPGDTITYTISMGAVENIVSIKFKLSIPSGLTYVDGSGQEVDGLSETLKAEKAEFTEATKVFVVSATKGYTSTTDTTLMTFQCKVDDDASGDKTATVIIDDADNIFDTSYDNITFTITGATVNITAAPAHTHNYGTEWKYNETSHWHECTCGDKTEVAEHTFGEWEITKEASETEPGSKKHTCSICEFEETVEIPVLAHTHNYGTEWKYNEISHWHECTCGDKAQVGAHVFKWVVDKAATETKNGSKHEECTICGYQRPAVEIPATGGGSGYYPEYHDPVQPAIVMPPTTGDSSSLSLWIALLFVSGAGAAGAAVYGRKKKKNAE